MSRKDANRYWLFATGILVVAAIVVAVLAPGSNIRVGDAATALAIISATAIGIERTIELIWTIVGLTKGAFWPLNLIGQHAEGMVDELNTNLKPIYEHTAVPV